VNDEEIYRRALGLLDKRTAMNAYQFAVIALASAGANSLQALERPVAQIQLVCPDRSPRMADISLAVSRGHYQATQAERNRMLERVRSVCAAGLSVVSLIPPDDLSAQRAAFVSSTKD
jgi:hypothetical protein